jgi:beta-mannosidase
VASWASIDYFGRWKALHYQARRFYEPVLLSIEDQSPMMDVHVSNDLTETWDGFIRWTIETISGEKVDSGKIEVKAEALRDTLVHSFDFSASVTEENKRDLVFICELWQGEKLISSTVSTFVPNKHLSFSDPNLNVTVRQAGEKFVFTVSASSMARFVELNLAGADVVFSDNYFDVPAGREVQVTCPMPDGWTVGKAESSLTIYSLYNSFA